MLLSFFWALSKMFVNLGSIMFPTAQNNSPTHGIYKYNYLPVGTYKVQLNADDPQGSLIVKYNVRTKLLIWL